MVPVELAVEIADAAGSVAADAWWWVVQLTPPGSAASIVIGTGMTSMTPGSLEGLQLVVPDMGAARAELLSRGADVSEVEELGGVQFAYFGDPDGNRWVIQGATPSDVRDAHLDGSAS